MSNQVLLWVMFIVPWLTLFFMKKEDIKRFMPVALFAAFTSMIVDDAAGTLNLWVIRESIFPLSHTDTQIISLIPVLTIWLFKYTYGKVWRYIAVDAVINLMFTLIILPWFGSRGIIENILATNLISFSMSTIHGLTLYVYQMWQEAALAPAIKKLFSTKPQLSATKPIFEDGDNKDNL